MPQTTLYLDTTTKEIKIILFRDESILDQKIFTSNDNSENQVIEEIDSLLKNHQFDIHKIDNLIVNTGPGGFTGTRISVSFANAIKLVRPEMKLFSISNPVTHNEIISTVSQNKSSDVLIPEYYSQPSITSPTSKA